ncbi:hypothetical protein MNB_SM-4-316 [hydrothermal vent metagenome]|uniref:Uncharacterized protein n=1 Tax=hydrothermal vent metagenome TaxID=652676 RepID=A0A1W1BKL6_9ZZZZ
MTKVLTPWRSLGAVSNCDIVFIELIAWLRERGIGVALIESKCTL